MCPVEPSRFSERLGYARWLYHLVKGVAPTHAGIGSEVGRSGVAVGYWMDDAEPPSDYRVHAPLARYLGVRDTWLIRNEGQPPRPELWNAWIEERRRAAATPALRVTERSRTYDEALAATGQQRESERELPAKPTAKKATRAKGASRKAGGTGTA